MINETIYLAGWEINFNDPNDLKKFLLTHRINETDFNFYRQHGTLLKLTIENNKITTCTECYRAVDGTEVESERTVNIDLPTVDLPIHRLGFLESSSEGLHKIGGKKPDEFNLPAHSVLKTPFVYLGTIDGTDPHFSWMNLAKFHLAFPLYECVFGLFVDYSDPFSLKLLNPEKVTDAWFETTGNVPDNLEFAEYWYKVIDAIDGYLIENSLQQSVSIPGWRQYPDIPVCPKTCEIMRFVCEIQSDNETKLINHTDNLKIDDYLIFGDYGTLYVFYHPESKIAYYNYQW